MSSETDRTAIEADRILNEPLFVKTLKEMEARVLDRTLNPRASSADHLEGMIEIRMLRALPEAFRAHVRSAKQAAAPKAGVV